MDLDPSLISLIEASGSPGDAAAFFPVGLEGFPAGGHAPCDLFLRSRAGRYVLYAGQGLLFDDSKRRQLSAAGLTSLHVRREEAALYFNFLKETLVSLVQNPSTPAAVKARAVHSSCREVLRQVLEEPRAAFLAQAEAIISPTVDLIVSGGEAVRHLIDLTAYDHSTYVHSTNVGIFAVALARRVFGRSAEHDLKRLGAGFFLHDLGKRQIPLAILNKPAALTSQERQIVNLHPEDGHRLLLGSSLLTEEARIIILQHHERDDGRGYPHGLRAGDIHPYARICRLVDVYEALTSKRPYHQQRSTFEALKLMREEVLVDIDRSLFEAFLGLFSR
jgi:HD-GYP domain-containing protein (c-di-GMP phosphodiesterase class II)